MVCAFSAVGRAFRRDRYGRPRPKKKKKEKRVTGQVTSFRTIHHQENGENMLFARNHEELDFWDPWSAPIAAF